MKPAFFGRFNVCLSPRNLYCLHRHKDGASFKFWVQKNLEPRFFKKAQPAGFLGFGLYWVFRFFLFEKAVGKLVCWFSSSAKLLFRFTSTLDYLKIRKFIILIVRSCKHKEIFNFYWRDKLKLNVVWCGFFAGILNRCNLVGFLGITRVSEPCLNLASQRYMIEHASSKIRWLQWGLWAISGI